MQDAQEEKCEFEFRENKVLSAHSGHVKREGGGRFLGEDGENMLILGQKRKPDPPAVLVTPSVACELAGEVCSVQNFTHVPFFDD